MGRMRVYSKGSARLTLFDIPHEKLARDSRGLLIAAIAAAALAGFVVLGAFPTLRADLVSSVGELFDAAGRSHLGLPAVILLFVATAYFGAPQALLIGACVLAFGPTSGFWFSWIATIVSGAVTFHSGRAIGTAPNAAAHPRLLRRLYKNGFLASFAMRFVPGPPFILVNMALAAARVGFWPYIAGLTIGVLPKTAIIAFAGGSIVHALDGELGRAALLLGGGVLCVLAVVLTRRLITKRLDEEGDERSSYRVR